MIYSLSKFEKQKSVLCKGKCGGNTYVTRPLLGFFSCSVFVIMMVYYCLLLVLLLLILLLL